MVRVKATGEVTEVSREVMKALRAEEKRMRRSFASESLDDEQAEGGNTVLSLDALPDDDVKSAAWLADPHSFTEELTMRMLIENFVFSVKISIPLENTGVSSVFATSVWPFSLIFSLARRNEGNFFQAVPTTLSRSLAEVRLASLVAWA